MTKHWQTLKDRTIEFPAACETSPSNEPSKASPQLPQDDYPLLRATLRDSGLQFKPYFYLQDLALITGRSSKTLRDWIKKGQIPCHYWPSGSRYHTPHDLEDLLANTGREKRGGYR